MTRITLSKKRKPVFAGALRFISGLLRAVTQSSHYSIKRGYIHREAVELYDDSDMADEYQKEVYTKAAQLMRDHHWTSVIDIGCGSGFKLIHYLGEFETTGVDLDWMIGKTSGRYPDRRWIASDAFDPAQVTADMIICADVIEHVEDPAAFLRHVFSIANWQCAVISTPERDLKRGWHHYGPPPNPHHYREWNQAELARFISTLASIESHYVIDEVQCTQVVICRKRGTQISQKELLK